MNNIYKIIRFEWVTVMVIGLTLVGINIAYKKSNIFLLYSYPTIFEAVNGMEPNKHFSYGDNFLTQLHRDLKNTAANHSDTLCLSGFNDNTLALQSVYMLWEQANVRNLEFKQGRKKIEVWVEVAARPPFTVTYFFTVHQQAYVLDSISGVGVLKNHFLKRHF